MEWSSATLSAESHSAIMDRPESVERKASPHKDRIAAGVSKRPSQEASLPVKKRLKRHVAASEENAVLVFSPASVGAGTGNRPVPEDEMFVFQRPIKDSGRPTREEQLVDGDDPRGISTEESTKQQGGLIMKDHFAPTKIVKSPVQETNESSERIVDVSSGGKTRTEDPTSKQVLGDHIMKEHVAPAMFVESPVQETEGSMETLGGIQSGDKTHTEESTFKRVEKEPLKANAAPTWMEQSPIQEKAITTSAKAPVDEKDDRAYSISVEKADFFVLESLTVKDDITMKDTQGAEEVETPRTEEEASSSVKMRAPEKSEEKETTKKKKRRPVTFYTEEEKQRLLQAVTAVKPKSTSTSSWGDVKKHFDDNAPADLPSDFPVRTPESLRIKFSQVCMSLVLDVLSGSTVTVDEIMGLATSNSTGSNATGDDELVLMERTVARDTAGGGTTVTPNKSTVPGLPSAPAELALGTESTECSEPTIPGLELSVVNEIVPHWEPVGAQSVNLEVGRSETGPGGAEAHGISIDGTAEDHQATAGLGEEGQPDFGFYEGASLDGNAGENVDREGERLSDAMISFFHQFHSVGGLGMGDECRDEILRRLNGIGLSVKDLSKKVESTNRKVEIILQNEQLII